MGKGREAMAWSDAPTEKQLMYLEELREMSAYPIPKFTGKTRKDVQEYIEKYRKTAYQRTDKFGFY